MYDKRDVMCGSVTLTDMMGDELNIVNSARVSFGKRKDLLDSKDEELIEYLWKHKHTSPFEKVQLLFHVKCPLPIAKQWMRHRTWSYNEISRRYTSDNVEFHVPLTFRKQDDVNKQSSQEDSTFNKEKEQEILYEYEKLLVEARGTYNFLIASGVCREQARFLLPQALMTEFYASVNLKNLMDFLRLRMAPDAQLEIRVFANAIYDLIKHKLPICMGLLNPTERTK